LAGGSSSGVVVRVPRGLDEPILMRVIGAIQSLMLPASTRIFVYAKPIDMRRSFDALGQCVRDVLKQEPESGALFNLARENAATASSSPSFRWAGAMGTSAWLGMQLPA
jgi:hypothetical protein